MRDPTAECDQTLTDCASPAEATALSDRQRPQVRLPDANSGAGARTQLLAQEQARVIAAAIPAAERTSRFYQPFEGGVILRDNEPWWGFFWCGGLYLPNGAERAQRAVLERDHLEALRGNDWLDRARLRFEITDAGSAALAEPR